MSLPAVRRLTHSSPRTLARIPVSRLPTFASSSRIPSVASRVSQAPRFSTMAARQSAASPASVDKSYDPEIQDMASYIHEYNVDSDLAVC
jgi:2-methylcitrate dehydratase